MRTVRIARTSLTLLALSLALAACGGGQPTPQPDPSPQPTPVGTPVGQPFAKVIGATGGTLATPDGTVTLEIPAGALAKDETVSIQEITARAPGATGKAFRLSPEGVKFAKPVKLSFKHSGADVAGSAPELLRVAYQAVDGVWKMQPLAVLDSAAKTVTTQTDHFSDWSLVSGAQLKPQSAKVKAGESLELSAVNCLPLKEEPGDVALGYTCYEVRETAPLRLEGWAVNGSAGGGGAAGTVAGRGRVGAVYTAPGRRPRGGTVAVSARAVFEALNTKEQVTLVAQVEIVEDADPTDPVNPPGGNWTGTLTFEETGELTGHKGEYDPGVGNYRYAYKEVLTVSEGLPLGDFVSLVAKSAVSVETSMDYHARTEETGRCAPNTPTVVMRVQELNVTKKLSGAQSRDTGLSFAGGAGDAYTLTFVPVGGEAEGQEVTRTTVVDNCNPAASRDETVSKEVGEFHGADGSFTLKGTLDPANPNRLTGSYTATDVARAGQEIPTTVHVTWNLSR